MKVVINGKEIQLDNKDVVLARKAVNGLIAVARAGAEKSGSLPLYYTTIVMMYLKSKTILDSLGPDNLSWLMDLLSVDERKEKENEENNN